MGLYDKDREVRRRAASYSILQWLTDTEYQMRVKAVKMLGDMGINSKSVADAVLPHIKKALSDENAEVRRNAVDALGKLSSTSPVAVQPLLEEAAQSEDEQVRFKARTYTEGFRQSRE